MVSKKANRLSPTHLRYKDIALEYIKSGYKDIQSIYHKYYPHISTSSLQVLPYRLLDNVLFQQILREAWLSLKIEDIDIARDVVLCLHKEMLNAKNASDRIAAASWLGKKEAMFTDNVKQQTTMTIEQREAIFNRIKKYMTDLKPLAQCKPSSSPQVDNTSASAPTSSQAPASAPASSNPAPNPIAINSPAIATYSTGGQGGEEGKGRESHNPPSLPAQLLKSSSVASRVAMAKEVKGVVISKRTGKPVRVYRKHPKLKSEVQSA